jgi:hypothetical protein
MQSPRNLLDASIEIGFVFLHAGLWDDACRIFDPLTASAIEAETEHRYYLIRRARESLESAEKNFADSSVQLPFAVKQDRIAHLRVLRGRLDAEIRSRPILVQK